jgi:hypothetical protein
VLNALNVNSGAFAFLNSSETLANTGTVAVNGDLFMGTSIVSGGTTFTVASGALLGIGNTAGITSSGASGNVQTPTRNFSTGGFYEYTASAAQVTGSGLPAQVAGLIIGDASGVTLTNSTQVTGNGFNGNTFGLELSSGILNLGGHTLTMANASSILMGGGSLAAAPVFSGTIDLEYFGNAVSATGPEFPTSTSVLRDLDVGVNLGNTLNLQSDATVNRNLILGQGLLALGSHTITVDGNFSDFSAASGGGLSAGTGTVNLQGTTAQSIGGSVATAFNNLTINNAAGVVTGVAGTKLGSNGTLTLTSGTFSLSSGLTLGSGDTIVRSGGTLSTAPVLFPKIAA